MPSEMIRRSTVANEIADQVKVLLAIYTNSEQKYNETKDESVREFLKHEAFTNLHTAKALWKLARKIGASDAVQKEFEKAGIPI